MGRTACTEHQCLYKGALYLYLYLPGDAACHFLCPSYHRQLAQLADLPTTALSQRHRHVTTLATQ